jgi:hypothetical protein
MAIFDDTRATHDGASPAPRPAGADSGGLRILDLRPLLVAPLRAAPYPHVIGAGCLRPEALPALRRDFPDLRQAGFHPADAFEPRGTFADLLREVEEPEVAAVVGGKLGVDLVPLPRLVTVRKLSAAHEGRIHTDSASKVATLLLYLNPGWSSPEGRLRVLRRGDGFDDPVAEISPEEGNAFAFLRSDRSWHGHTPFVGERRVVQIAWLRDASEVERKRRRHHVSRVLKLIFGG